MNRKPLDPKENVDLKGATVLAPGDFPLGSVQSRAAVRLRLQGIGDNRRGSAACICFPENEPPFFCSEEEEKIAARVKCPQHGNRFKQPIFHVFVSKWICDKEPLRRQQLSAQYQKAWAASFPAGGAEPEVRK